MFLWAAQSTWFPKITGICERNVRGAKEQIRKKEINDRRHKAIFIVRHERDFILSLSNLLLYQ